MSTRIRLEEADQTIVILVEGDYAAIHVFDGILLNEDLEEAEAVMLLSAQGVDRMLEALFQARIAIERESVGEFLNVMTCGYGYGTETK